MYIDAHIDYVCWNKCGENVDQKCDKIKCMEFQQNNYTAMDTGLLYMYLT